MKRILAFCLLIVLVMSLLPPVSAADSKLVALTFDDGPGPYTEKLLNGLAEKGVKATFFCLGQSAATYPELVKRMFDEGHQLANHSFNHPNLNEMTVDSAVYQITRTDAILNGITGGWESYYIRPPYGNITQAIQSRLQAPVFIWSVDTIDWMVLNAETVKNNILRDSYDGAVVLVHDIHRTTVDGVLDSIDTMIECGYEFVTLKELYRRRGVTLYGGQILRDCKPTGYQAGALSEPVMQVLQGTEDVELTLESADGAPIYYTLDGSPITYYSAVYSEPVVVELPCTIRAVAAWDLNGDRSREVYLECTQPMAMEPEVYTQDGELCFTSENEVYVSVDDGVTYELWEDTAVEPDTWFRYYGDGEGLAPTNPKTLLYTAEGNLFTDIQQTDWFYSAMDHGASRGYFLGTVMNPNGIVTRGMLAELLYRYAGGDAEGLEQPFTDVAEDAYYCDAVKWAYGNGIVDGMGDGTYEPERSVSRQEMAKIFAAYLALEPVEEVFYEDQADIAEWAMPYVQAVTNGGLMQGSNDCFNPKGTATRAEIATILMRLNME